MLSAQPVSQPVPALLLYEEWEGKPVYYKGYRKVQAGEKKAAGIIGFENK